MKQALQQQLQALIANHGSDIVMNPVQCERLLLTGRPERSRELFLVLTALREEIPRFLHRAQPDVPYELLQVRLIKRLEDRCALAYEQAYWAVDTWAAILRVNRRRTRARPPRPAVQPLHSGVREQLRTLLIDEGMRLLDPPLCNALLADLCSEHPREVFVLVAMLDEGVVGQLLDSAAGPTRSARIAAAAQAMQEACGFTKETAQWSAETWQAALEALALTVVDRLQALLDERPHEIATMYTQYATLLAILPDMPKRYPRIHALANLLQSMADLQAAVTQEDEATIVAAAARVERALSMASIDESAYSLTASLSARELERVTLAQKRTQVRDLILAAAAHRQTAEVVRIAQEHAALLHEWSRRDAHIKELVTSATHDYLRAQLDSALEQGDEQAIQSALGRALDGGVQFSQSERADIEQTRYKNRLLARVKRAIAANDDQAIIQAYDQHWLADDARFDQADARRVELARQRLARLAPLQIALAADDDRSIAELYNEELFKDSPRLSADERARGLLAQQRMEAYQQLIHAFTSDNDDEIVQRYHATLLDQSSLLTEPQRRRIQAALSAVQHHERVRHALASDDDQQIAAAYRAANQASVNLAHDDQWRRILTASVREEKLTAFRTALASGAASDRELAALGSTVLRLAPDALTEDERRRIHDAIRAAGKRLATRSS